MNQDKVSGDRDMRDDQEAPFSDRHAAQAARHRQAENPGDDPASGSIDAPVSPGEPQAGDLSEAGANLGGPVDVFPLGDRRRKERPAG